MIYVSDLLFPGFSKHILKTLPMDFGIEFFYEFATETYWDVVLPQFGANRYFSIHGPCVSVNLADPEDAYYLEEYMRTFAYGKKINAKHVVVHTNDSWHGNKAACQDLSFHRLHLLTHVSEYYEIPMVIENVGLGQYNLFNEQEYIELLKQFPAVHGLLDVGHAHVNHWDLIRVIQQLGSKLSAYHIHDNHSLEDEHMPVGSGTIPWQEVFSNMQKYSPEANIVVEYASGFSDIPALMQHWDTVMSRYHICSNGSKPES